MWQNTTIISIKYFYKYSEYFFQVFLYYFNLIAKNTVAITQKPCYNNLEGWGFLLKISLKNKIYREVRRCSMKMS